MLRHMPIEFDEAKHPRGQPDNAGKFKRKPVPTVLHWHPGCWVNSTSDTTRGLPQEGGVDADVNPTPKEPNSIIWFWSPKGGSGTSTVAAATAIRLASGGREVVLVDLAGDQVALLGLYPDDKPDTPGISDWVMSNKSRDSLDGMIEKVATGLSLVRLGTRSLVRLGTRSPADLGDTPIGSTRRRRLTTALKALAHPDRAVVVDAGLDPHAHRGHIPAVPVCVIRTCYLALSRAQNLPGPYERIVVIQEPQRALRTKDIATALGADDVEVIAWDPRVGRSVDAGTIVQMLPPQLKRGLDGVVGLYGTSAA